MRSSVPPRRPMRRSTAQMWILLASLALLCGAAYLLVQSSAPSNVISHPRRQTIRQIEDGLRKGLGAATTIRLSSPPPPLDPCMADTFQDHVELDGEVIRAGAADPGDSGSKGLSAESAHACCSACKETRSCNVWVWGGAGGAYAKQCWLKRVGRESKVRSRSASPDLPWTSGIVKKDYDRDVESLPPLDPAIKVVALTTPHGVIRIRLMPGWHLPSVQYVQRLAMTPDLCTPRCEFYRAEPEFLLQGSLRGYLPANNQTKEGPKFMERGEIGWAGGSSGPDFFIYLGNQPASHWGKSHTVWGKIADDASMAVVEKIVMLPAKAPTPGAMHMMTTREPISIGVAPKR